MKKIFIALALTVILSCLLVVGVSARELYLEEIPEDLLISGDTVTHFLVIEGEEYYGGSGSTVNSFNMDKIQLGIIIFAGSILIFLLNTFVLYVDSKVYGYYSFVYIFGTIVPRTVICLAKAAVFTAVMPMLLEAAGKVLK